MSARTEHTQAIATVYVVPAEQPVKVWGLVPEQRIARQLLELGVSDVRRAKAQDYPRQGTVLLLRGDVVYDDPILAALLDRPGVRVERAAPTTPQPLAAHVPASQAAEAEAWLRGASGAPPHTAPVAPERMGDGYRRKLRKREDPYCLQVDRSTRHEVERRIYMGAYKGVTDAVTKYIWPIPAMWTTRACVRLGVTPNMVTLVSAVLVLAALWAFANGALGWGLLAAWPMTFLDTVDGKLARVTLRSSKFGNLFDHGIDLVHPPLWYWAWLHGLAGTAYGLASPWTGWTVAAIFTGYVLGRLAEGFFTRRFGFDLFVWTRFDSAFREVTARRNPCLLLLTGGWLLGRPDLGILATAAWLVLSAAIQVIRAVQAERAVSRGQSVTPWLQAPA